MPTAIRYKHGVKIWAYCLKFDAFGRPDMALSFQPKPGILSATACQKTYTDIEANMQSTSRTPPARFFVPLKNGEPNWNDIRRLRGTRFVTNMFHDETEAVKNYTAELQSAIAAVETTAATLRAMLLKTRPETEKKGGDIPV